MDQYDITYAREHLAELIEKAARGEDVSIVDPARGAFRLTADGAGTKTAAATAAQTLPYDLTAPRVTDTMPKFVPLAKKRVPGQLKGKMQVPARLMEPMTDDELRDWYGDDA
jgi:antitoxin (DNA-binding transcriptional repressor) of toxin-antitoxin stability system